MMALCVDWPNVACAPVSEPYSPIRMSPLLLAAFPPPLAAVSFLGGQPATATARVIVRNFRRLRLISAFHLQRTGAHSTALRSQPGRRRESSHPLGSDRRRPRANAV